jgi:protein tyrosine/serine phosphatase
MSVWDPPSDDQANEFVRVVSDPGNGPVFVFCSDGLHRTGELTAIYRVAHDGWSVERALAEMDGLGFNPYYYSLRQYVWTWARKFQPTSVPASGRSLSAVEK